jgi:hypothetical protein
VRIRICVLLRFGRKAEGVRMPGGMSLDELAPRVLIAAETGVISKTGH